MPESDGIEQSKKRRLPFVPGQHAITDSPSGPDDLTRDVDDRRDEGAEVHGQKTPPLFAMIGAQRGETGTRSAIQAFSDHANAAMTM